MSIAIVFETTNIETFYILYLMIMNRIRMFFAQWIRAVSTFPIAFVILAVMSIIGICMVYSDYDNTEYLLKMILGCLVALPLTLLSPLQTHISNKETNYKDILFSALGVVVGFIYYMFLPIDFENTNRGIQITTIGGVWISWVLLLFVIAWKKKDNELMTWVWWKEFLLSIVMGGIAGGVIWGGISACLASLDYLFGVSINSHAYGYVGMVSMIFITGAIALIHLVNQDTQDYTPTYSRSMRIFGHYIFLPLTIIYGCILISYGIKILISGVRPQGMIVYMVTGYVCFGILTRLTTYPALPNGFISKAHSVLFISYLLTSFLMIQATRMRIDQYGLTIARYFVCAIIAWIIITSILNLFFEKRRYVIMITTLVVLGFISIYGGPWNAVSTSNNSQKNILIQTLGAHGITLPLTSGSLVGVTSGDADKIYETVYYLCDAGIVDTIHSLLPESEQGNLDTQSTYMKADFILRYAGLDYSRRGIHNTPELQEEYFSRGSTINNTTGSRSISLVGYTTLYELTDTKRNIASLVTVDGEQEKYTLNLGEYGQDIYTISLAIRDNREVGELLKKNISYTPSGIIITTDTFQLILTNISGYKKIGGSGDIYTIQYYQGFMLVR